jgi:hypothetical protein
VDGQKLWEEDNEVEGRDDGYAEQGKSMPPEAEPDQLPLRGDVDALIFR